MKKQIHLLGSLLVVMALLTMNTNAFADVVIKNGSTIKVSSGADFVVSSPVTVEVGGTLDNDGTVTLKGNFTNNGTADLGEGTVVFSGTAIQNIGGTTVSEFEDLTINNAAGVITGIDSRVDGDLSLTSGLFVLAGTYNLTLGTAATIVGTPTSSNMIATATGSVTKLFTDGSGLDPAAFNFPIGDLSSEYTPIQVDFNNGDFAVGASLTVNLATTKEPNNSSADNFLSRYWTLTASGISGYNYDVLAYYADGDISGTEADISGALYDGSGWLIGDPVTAGTNALTASGYTDDGNITGVEFRILSDIKIFCQAAYNSTSNEMTTLLNPYIPLTAAEAYSHISYAGTESVGVIPSADVVDWILVEVRDAATAATATSATLVETVAGFLMKDGSIVGTDGVSPLPFRALITNNAYFVVIHRNHIPVMTSASPTESFGNYSYDFSDVITKAYGTNAMYQVDASPVTFGIFSGETNLSGIITNSDKVPIDLNPDASGYYLGDVNFSGIVSNADKVFIDLNMGKTTQLP